jgi:hypothetical protein
MLIRNSDDEGIDELGTLICQVAGVDPEQVPGFVVLVAHIEEDGTAGGRMITSTPNLRHTQKLIQVGLGEVDRELDKLAGLS